MLEGLSKYASVMKMVSGILDYKVVSILREVIGLFCETITVSSSEHSGTRLILMFWSIEWRAWKVTRGSEYMTAEGKLGELREDIFTVLKCLTGC